MSSFTGVSVADGNNQSICETSAVDASGDSGYHLFMVKAYSRIKDLLSMGECVASGSFTIGGHDWLIEYYPNGDNPHCAGFISLFLTLLDTDVDVDGDVEEAVEAKFSFSLIDQVEKQMPMYVRGTCETRSFSGSAPTWGNGRFVRTDTLERSADLRSDCFTIRCDVVVCNTKDDDAGGTEALPSDIHQHFSALLQNKVGADVTFQVGSETFAAHRCVLAARSTVFMAQLFGPMKEGTASSSSVIHIKDMEAKVFKALLSFVYTDSFPEMYEEIMEENAMSAAAEEQGQEVEEVEDETGLQWLLDLLVAADRYDLQRLKFICEKQLSQRIGVSSVASVLALAEQHHCHGLKVACLKFIQAQSPSCLQTVMATDGWDHVYTTYPSLVNGFIAKLIKSNQK
ncbi:hypothetical protein CFC21_081725 [Triticum aestivum]|uniref:BTB domain-containing protein n=2 Tax=Triticum aestivum TaxID=4565 RepID=A0A3B6NK85_WHEAT|nr:BTB/POZ and MATH domain-containing protein 1-like [Triticum aestivum]KAF7077141.1 hypothetical protein CFC21_081725 [Triticum aestivum]